MFDLYFVRRFFQERRLAELAKGEERSARLRACDHYSELMTDRRCEGREPCRIVAHLLRIAPWPVPANVCNVSTAGFQLGTRERLEPGMVFDMLVLGLPPFPVQVVWRGNGEVGCRFVEPSTSEALKAAALKTDGIV